MVVPPSAASAAGHGLLRVSAFTLLATRAKVLAIEVGFHSEYPKEVENEAVIAHLVANEKRWRRTIGKEAEIGAFIGRADRWRRVSETWPDPDLGDADIVTELATRLTDYITALEPLRCQRPKSSR